MTNFWAWCALRFLVGGASIAYNTVQTVYLIEITGQKWRSVTNNYFRWVFGRNGLLLQVVMGPG